MLYPAKNSLQIQWRNEKLDRQTKAKRIPYHQTRFTTNAKGTPLGRKKKKATTRNRKIMKWRGSPVKANIQV